MFKSFVTASFLAFATLSPAFADDMKLVRSIVISGHGEVRAAPDFASLSLGVFKNAMTANEALAANTVAMQTLMAALKAAGIADKDMQTSNFSVNPRYDYKPDGSPPLANGFDVSNSLTVTVRKLDNLGAILDASVNAGANQINGIAFGVNDSTTVMDSARNDAVTDAKRKAELYAKASGVKLGDVININEGGSYQPQPMVMAQAMKERSADVPIAQGEQVLAVDVSITWEIK